jgi:hypothetical protein
MRRVLAGAGMSLILHALVLFGMGLLKAPSVSVQYEIDVVNAPPAPPEDGKGEPRPQRAQARARRVASETGTVTSSKPEIEKPEEEKPQTPMPDLTPVAPASARLVVLVRTDRLRGSPLADAARAGMTALPDGELAIQEGLDPLEDFEALLVATANPRDVTETFLAARLRNIEKVHEKFHPPGGYDPRVLVFPGPKTAVMGKPEHVAAIGSGWVKALTKFAEDPAGDSLVEVTVNGLSGVLQIGRNRVPLPRTGQARLSWPPKVHARLVYADENDAQQLATAWPDMSAQIEGSIAVRMFGFGGVTRGAKVTSEGNVVTLDATLEQRHLEAVSTVIKLFMDSARAKGQRPAIPLPKIQH